MPVKMVDENQVGKGLNIGKPILELRVDFNGSDYIRMKCTMNGCLILGAERGVNNTNWFSTMVMLVLPKFC